MSNHANFMFFLGANTQDGFYSRFDELRNLPNYRHQYIIKGCPGSGKSTFMRRIAQAAAEKGHKCECICCSSDANSLDGVLIHDLGISFVDGTAPHVVEPRYAGALEQYIDFSPFWETEGLESVKREIMSIDVSIKTCYRNAYGHLRCAGVYDTLVCSYGTKNRSEDMQRRVGGLIKREIPKNRYPSKASGHRFVRYLSGFTPTGQVTFYNTVHSMCDRVIGFLDDFGTAHDVLARISETALQAGYDVYECLSPLYASQRLEHLLIPKLSLGFVTLSKDDDRIAPDKRINLNAYVLDRLTREELQTIKMLQKKRKAAIGTGLQEIAMAKMHHDALEAVYRPYIQFEKINVLTEDWLETLGLC